MCQCPRRALLISTDDSETQMVRSCKVSMPSAGSSHFYGERRKSMKEKMDVSMPSAGSSHFYMWKESSLQKVLMKVSMPSAGSSHFYSGIISSDCSRSSGCQCPRRALLISTFPKKEMMDMGNTLCQCPRRALLISTATTELQNCHA